MRFVQGFFAILVSVWAFTAMAHEVRPTIGDLWVQDGTARLELDLNLEAFVAGIDLDGIMDTNDTDKSEQYDALRALSATELQNRLQEAFPQIGGAIDLRAGETSVPLTLDDVQIGEVGNIDLPRDSRITLGGALPPGAASVTLHWPEGFGTLVLRQQGVEDPYTDYLDGGQTSAEIAVAGGSGQGAWSAFFSYIPVGFDHILPLGLDHILFVLGLFFLSSHWRPLLWQVSAFTLAHTITLALAALGWVNVPGSIVEPLIAASIVYVAVENVLHEGLNKWRPVVIFGFGLLHGLGFASVLGEFGLPQGQFLPALIGFNIGVEFGQLTVIAVAFLLIYFALRVDRGELADRPVQIGYAVAAVIIAMVAGVGGLGADVTVFLWPIAGLMVLCSLSATFVDQLGAYRRFVAIPASVGIALVGAYWFIERVFL